MTQRPLILITGASAGIGAALARIYAANGWDLALVARREEPMVALAETLKAQHDCTSIILPADLSDRTENEQLIARVHAKGRKIHGLINNAGYGLPGRYHDQDWDAHRASLDLMLNGPCELVHRVLPDMKADGFGRIINVASLAGHLPGSRGHTTYAAIKSFLIKFSQSLNLEMGEDGINVCALCPGFTYSEFHDVNGTRGAVSKMPSWMWQEAEEVTAAAYAACERGKAVHVTGGANKTIAALAKILPESLALSLMRKQSEKFRRDDA
ncbi:SDR family NAD(P)-dependent oxidoreductase [Robiginitomaculum antarcticum]|uniref:SDR family NAD(P)-dependent oxidoreductase n=1 Tax=Robiginitomaculum antarcticum TaxID=437507 RepID=UPI0003606C8A|nr:SDR family oxidoreductase [Robiginitomaculum antarcticum]